MSAILQFLDSDNSTVITTLDEGSIASPGSSANKKLYVKNNGDQTAQGTTVSIEQIGTNDGSLYALIALDSGGSPGTFGTSQISLGNITAGSSVALWAKITLITGLTSAANPRRFNLTANALTL